MQNAGAPCSYFCHLIYYFSFFFFSFVFFTLCLCLPFLFFPPLLGAFAKSRNATVSFAVYVRRSIRPHGTTRLPQVGI